MTDITASELFIQQESVTFDRPVSEASLSAIGALANAMRQVISPVGTILYSVLDETTFQTQNGATPVRWILADGRDVTGSAFQTLTGSTAVPDLRGIFVRGKNGARSTATGNPDGDLAIGTYTFDKLKAHTHSVTDPGHVHGTGGETHTHTATVTDSGHSHTFPINSNFIVPSTNNNVPGTNDTTAAVTTPFNHMNSATTGITVANVAAATGISIQSNTTGISIQNTGGNETAPRDVTLNAFIRIN